MFTVTIPVWYFEAAALNFFLAAVVFIAAVSIYKLFHSLIFGG